MTLRAITRLAAAGALAALVGACALLSSPDPVQLYRFGSDASTSPTSPMAQSPMPVLMRPVNFPEASKGDRILGVTGLEAAYIKGARWVSPAEDLYGQSLQAAFASQATRVRIIGLREASTAVRTLDIDIQAFEARYAAPGAVPEVLVTARARILRYPERTVVTEKAFTVRQPAAENRIGAIVEAFDMASRDLNTQIVSWTEANVG
ncbi:cholesterol transport system auxiliary component [Brevundimonas alba]|uniref:Cholesterol transport system auxiliary component n=1 Tax=Brevundimonas alba TaxID=74314 RepID=A0A7X5YKK6_9CAUL|nr:ABC-type transport auxiliary lipoprotein family protein [Brevundimonas alba]NJC41628.1 cholesterol transport system auxiliary component [Brevundimonas alba]